MLMILILHDNNSDRIIVMLGVIFPIMIIMIVVMIANVVTT